MTASTPSASRRVIVLSRGEQATVGRLREQAEEVARWRRGLKGAEARRNLLILKLRRAGLPARFIETHAGVSNVTVLLIEKRSRNGAAHG